jgi:glucan 1,3-beta-glucosidase
LFDFSFRCILTDYPPLLSLTHPVSHPRYARCSSRSINIGGWLNLELFITPALYEPFNLQAVDEWTLSTLLQAQNGNLDVIANHYATFITEEDFAQIAAAGLNWVRIPLPFWAIEVYPNEPFLAKTSWTYFLKAIEWARKYGLLINLDLHAVPGSQNGWNTVGN